MERDQAADVYIEVSQGRDPEEDNEWRSDRPAVGGEVAMTKRRSQVPQLALKPDLPVWSG